MDAQWSYFANNFGVIFNIVASSGQRFHLSTALFHDLRLAKLRLFRSKEKEEKHVF